MNTLQVTIRKEIAINVLVKPKQNSDEQLGESIARLFAFLLLCR